MLETAAEEPDDRRLRCQHSVAMLQTEHNAKRARAFIGMRLRETAFDLRYASLVGVAVVGGLRDGAIAPVPLDPGAVILLEVVVSAFELGRCRHTHGHHAG